MQKDGKGGFDNRIQSPSFCPVIFEFPVPSSSMLSPWSVPFVINKPLLREQGSKGCEKGEGKAGRKKRIDLDINGSCMEWGRDEIGWDRSGVVDGMNEYCQKTVCSRGRIIVEFGDCQEEEA